MEAKPRVVLLGASNLTRGISTIVESARLVLGGRPLEILAALGHGRSYGAASRVLARTIPGIVDCGIWEALGDPAPPANPASTHALITDVGNDILYGASPGEIAGWIELCIDRLERARARIVMTRLPMDSVRSLPRWRFEIVRRVIFPRCPISFAGAIERASELHERLEELGEARGARMVDMDGAWYGFDPIHIKMRSWPEAWRAILGSWTDEAPPPGLAGASLARWVRLRTTLPEQSWWLGRGVRRAQPATRLHNGTTVGLF